MWKSTAITLVLLAGTREADAQRYVEFGANVGQACLMGEASCADEVMTRGWQTGLWITEKMAIRLRHLDARRPDVVDPRADRTMRWSHRGRTLWLGEMTWHFGAPRAARFFVGFSVGSRRDRLLVTCEPVACVDPWSLTEGQHRTTHITRGAVAGVSIHPIRRLVITGQLGCHDFPGEHAGTFAFTAHVAYRHPLGR